MIRAMRFLIALCGALALTAPAAAQEPLVTELAQHHVDITAQYTGQKVLIFGAVSQPGDIVIKVTSPVEKVAISRKDRYGPFWLTSGKFNVDGAPGLVYLLATKPVDELLDADQRARYGLTLRSSLNDASPTAVPANVADWRAAFLKLKGRDGHYQEHGNAIKMVGDTLFSANVDLPAKLPLGAYRLTIYLVRDGKVVAQQSRSLDVREVQIERWVSEVAYDHSWLFGIALTLLAMTLGLGLGVILRKDGDD